MGTTQIRIDHRDTESLPLLSRTPTRIRLKVKGALSSLFSIELCFVFYSIYSNVHREQGNMKYQSGFLGCENQKCSRVNGMDSTRARMTVAARTPPATHMKLHTRTNTRSRSHQTSRATFQRTTMQPRRASLLGRLRPNPPSL